MIGWVADVSGVVLLAAALLGCGGSSSEGGRETDSQGNEQFVDLAPDGSVRRQQRIASQEGGFTASLPKQARFGAALTAPGDLDGDQVPDLVAGAPGVSSGRLWLLYLNRDGTVRSAKEQKRG